MNLISNLCIGFEGDQFQKQEEGITYTKDPVKIPNRYRVKEGR